MAKENEMDDRDRLNEAFKRMRAKGLIAKQSHLCCGGCASADLGTRLEQAPSKVGAVYYHRQDREQLPWVLDAKPRRMWATRRETGVYLGYGARDGGSDLTVAGLVCEALAEAGLSWAWELGDTAARIWVPLS
jgi:hypothetical protein